MATPGSNPADDFLVAVGVEVEEQQVDDVLRAALLPSTTEPSSQDLIRLEGRLILSSRVAQCEDELPSDEESVSS